MATGPAHTPTFGDGIALTIDSPQFAWMDADIPAVVAMSQLQPGDTILILSCSTGAIIVEVVKALGVWPRRVVAIESVHVAIQQAVLKLEAMDLEHNVELICGNTYDMDAISGLQSTTDESARPTFDIILGRNALFFDSRHNSPLLNWASYLTPTTGRMVVTYTPTHELNPQLAGLQAIYDGKKVLARQS